MFSWTKSFSLLFFFFLPITVKVWIDEHRAFVVETFIPDGKSKVYLQQRVCVCVIITIMTQCLFFILAKIGQFKASYGAHVKLYFLFQHDFYSHIPFPDTNYFTECTGCFLFLYVAPAKPKQTKPLYLVESCAEGGGSGPVEERLK